MNQLFEFGDYWDYGTMTMFICLGLVICVLAKAGAKARTTVYGLVMSDNNSYKLRTVKVNIPYILIFSILLFLFTFRSQNTGADTIEYIKIFYNSTRITKFTSLIDSFNYYEPLFLLINYLIRKVTESYTVYFFIYGCIISYSYVRFICTFWTNDRNYIFLLLIATSFHYDLNVLRSAIGTSFVMLSLCAIVDGKSKKALLLTLIGTLFHYTVIINLPLLILNYIVEKKEYMSKRRIVLLVATGIAILYFIVPRMGVFLSATRYQSYLNGTATINILGMWNLIFTIILAIFLLIETKILKGKDGFLIVVGLYNIVPFLLNITLGMYRVSGFYFPARLSLWDKMPGRNPRNRQIVSLMCYLLVIFIFFYKMSRYSNSPGFKYEFIWSAK